MIQKEKDTVPISETVSFSFLMPEAGNKYESGVISKADKKQCAVSTK